MSEHDSDAVGPASGDAGGATTETTCVLCGSAVDVYEWYPLRGRTDDDGEYRLYSFCSEDCVETWEEANPE